MKKLRLTVEVLPGETQCEECPFNGLGRVCQIDLDCNYYNLNTMRVIKVEDNQ